MSDLRWLPPIIQDADRGGEVFFMYRSQWTLDGDRAAYGGKGKITGPVRGALDQKYVSVMFPGNNGNINCRLNRLSRTAPPAIAGGFRVGAKVIYMGDNDLVGHGSEGEVTGAKIPQWGVYVAFTNNNVRNIRC